MRFQNVGSLLLVAVAALAVPVTKADNSSVISVGSAFDSPGPPVPKLGPSPAFDSPGPPVPKLAHQ